MEMLDIIVLKYNHHSKTTQWVNIKYWMVEQTGRNLLVVQNKI